MIEVTRSNFFDLLPQIESAINNADFVSIDTEFTGLYLDDECKPSMDTVLSEAFVEETEEDLFDTSAERYQKLKRSVESFTVAQTGITAFVGDTRQNRYHAISFSFYLCPLAFTSVDPRFSLQSSAIQFLCAHKFDFNKCFNEGLPYLNGQQEKEILERLKAGPLHPDDDLFIAEREVQKLCSMVASWMSNGKTGNFLTLPLKNSGHIASYIVQNEIRQRFPNVWTSLNDFDQIIVEKVSDEKKMYLAEKVKEWEQSQHQQILRELLGFTLVVRMLQKAKKPLVGHNMLMDLLFVYSKFHQTLPDTYKEFKKEIRNIFPVIFDTKHLHHYLKQKFKCLNLKSARSLEALDLILKSQTTIGLTRMQPSIQNPCVGNTENETSVNTFHHAGYDSFICGCVFIRICHLEHFKENSALESTTSFTFQSYLSTMEKHRNCVNVIRASTNYTTLDGQDPSCARPPLLYVSYRGGNGKITSQQLAAEFSSHGTVDIKMITPTQAIVATSHFMEARAILYSFKNHATIDVTRFRFLLHSRLGTFIWWSALSAASGSCILLLYTVLRK